MHIPKNCLLQVIKLIEPVPGLAVAALGPLALSSRMFRHCPHEFVVPHSAIPVSLGVFYYH
jgi:hypothetical protein